jgi:hypothetical protein
MVHCFFLPIDRNFRIWLSAAGTIISKPILKRRYGPRTEVIFKNRITLGEPELDYIDENNLNYKISIAVFIEEMVGYFVVYEHF